MIRLERNPENPDHSKWVLIKISITISRKSGLRITTDHD